MKNTRGEPSAGGQTAPRETLPISCLFVLFRSLRVVRAANIVTMNYELSLLRRSRDGLQPSCASNRVVASSQREGIHVTKKKSVDMAPGAQLSSEGVS